MPKKRAASGGASKRNQNNKIDQLLIEMSKNYTPPPPEVFAEVEDRWVLVKVRLMNWDNMGFQIRVRESTNLYTIEQKIKERHGGSVTGVSFWKDSVAPGNEVGNQPGDLNNTLKSIFRFNPQSGHYVGGKNNSGPKINLQQEDEPELPLSSRSVDAKKKLNLFENVITEECDYECSLFYDFTPYETDCPLLQTSPRLSDVVKDDDYKKRKGSSVL
ncbi:predicted protein [Naegleria gruberi]|uniref:Predicted protein n=1 Tax=Naegleria gruberi TaxID=5762 RepID=D2UYC7_NAEGR|nr:uncharacterized protein NAEGRDRAFT_61425 [Naegleria gruberi]EFC50769.1 predicted protein [Naegleria gruberi]|eukprot:XP_002683513.1 predicted protein [Naegleria gruberi strain NEG-M]